MSTKKPTRTRASGKQTSEARSLSGNLTVAVVVLTTGNRDAQLRALAKSLDDQQAVERLLIVNGGASVQLKGWSETVLPENIGVPAGRSLGATSCTADVVVYLDDDCALVSDDLLTRVVERFQQRPELGVLGFRVQSTGGGAPMRRWTPAKSLPESDGLSLSVTFPCGGHAIRRRAFLEVGGYCDEIFFKHEETYLSWRLLDAGWEVAYDDSCVVEHPSTSEGRHPTALRVGARNKVWIARMALPAILVPVSVAITLARYVGRCRRASEVMQVGIGIRAGFRRPPDPREPMSWRTAWVLSKRGRPPVL